MTSSTASQPDKRRSKRFRFNVDVDVSDRRGVRRGRAVDVARHGMFIAIVDPPHNRHLVQLVIHLPRGPVQAAATVSRTLAGQGVGLSLFALSDDAKRGWDGFIAEVQQQEQRSAAGEPRTAAMSTGAPAFLLRLRTMDRLREFQRSHVTVGGTVLFTPVLLPEGGPVNLVVVHPLSEEEHLLPGRVHRAIAQHPKRLEILFGAVDHAAFARFVDSGLAQLPPLPRLASVPLLPADSVIPVTPAAAQVPVASDDDIDIEVLDEEMEDDPIEWDLRTSDLPVLMGNEIPATAPGRAAPAVSAAKAKAKADDDDDDDDDDDLLIDHTRNARDPGLRPTAVRIGCDRCSAESYVIELGPCAGSLGLVADLVPFWSGAQGRVVAVPRLIEASVRRERFSKYVGVGGEIEDLLPLATFLAAADLAEPACHPESGETLKTSRPIERLGLAARRVAVDDVTAPTRVRCPGCAEGHLLLERA